MLNRTGPIHSTLAPYRTSARNCPTTKQRTALSHWTAATHILISPRTGVRTPETKITQRVVSLQNRTSIRSIHGKHTHTHKHDHAKFVGRDFLHVHNIDLDKTK